MRLPFADLRSITGGAESSALGYDPLYENPGDPWNRRMTYPRIWQNAFALGINQSHTKYIGGVFTVLFFLGILIAFFPVDRLTALFLSIVIFSPAVLLGLERGSTDLFMLFLMSIALLAGRFSTILPLSLILLAALLKLFPIMGLSYLFKETRHKFFLLMAVALGLFGLYIAFTFADFQQIHRATPRGVHIAYGMNVFWMRVTDQGSQFGSLAKVSSYSLAVLVILSALFLRFKKAVSTSSQDNEFIDAFRMGASIYAGTFLLGNNWDYRLMFLIFTIPQLVVWMRKDHMWLSRLAGVTMLAIVVACWLYVISTMLSLVSQSLLIFLDELSTWLIFAGLTYFLAFSLPSWFAWPRSSLSTGSVLRRFSHDVRTE
jgi:hypothetical protein